MQQFVEHLDAIKVSLVVEVLRLDCLPPHFGFHVVNTISEKILRPELLDPYFNEMNGYRTKRYRIVREVIVGCGGMNSTESYKPGRFGVGPGVI